MIVRATPLKREKGVYIYFVTIVLTKPTSFQKVDFSSRLKKGTGGEEKKKQEEEKPH